MKKTFLFIMTATIIGVAALNFNFSFNKQKSNLTLNALACHSNVVTSETTYSNGAVQTNYSNDGTFWGSNGSWYTKMSFYVYGGNLSGTISFNTNSSGGTTITDSYGGSVGISNSIPNASVNIGQTSSYTANLSNGSTISGIQGSAGIDCISGNETSCTSVSGPSGFIKVL